MNSKLSYPASLVLCLIKLYESNVCLIIDVSIKLNTSPLTPFPTNSIKNSNRGINFRTEWLSKSIKFVPSTSSFAALNELKVWFFASGWNSHSIWVQTYKRFFHGGLDNFSYQFQDGIQKLFERPLRLIDKCFS